jgi:hypothetical protein
VQEVLDPPESEAEAPKPSTEMKKLKRVHPEDDSLPSSDHGSEAIHPSGKRGLWNICTSFVSDLQICSGMFQPLMDFGTYSPFFQSRRLQCLQRMAPFQLTVDYQHLRMEEVKSKFLRFLPPEPGGVE